MRVRVPGEAAAAPAVGSFSMYWLTAAVDMPNGTCHIEVVNSGDVLSEEQVAGILQPFRRAADNRRPGYGLGMTIVQSVAKAHGGSVDVRPRPEGGLEVVVELPAHRDPAFA